MFRRGGFSFVAMLVINPIVILFYQNCSMVPTSLSSRSVASVAETKVATSQQPKIAKATCNEGKIPCLDSGIE